MSHNHVLWGSFSFPVGGYSPSSPFTNDVLGRDLTFISLCPRRLFTFSAFPFVDFFRAIFFPTLTETVTEFFVFPHE